MTVDDDDSCTYSEEISTSIDDGEYVIQVRILANNTIGQSIEDPSVDTGIMLSSQVMSYMMLYFTVSVTLLQCTSTVTDNSITFNCSTSSIANAGYSIALDPGNMMGSAVIGMSLSFNNLNATTEYHYTAMLTDSGDVSYSITGTNITTAIK